MPLPIYTTYLSGPMKGLSAEEAMQWRTYVKTQLPEHIKAWDPFRGKEALIKKLNGSGKKLGDAQYGDTAITKPKGITARDRRDSMTCDCLFVNVLGAKTVSIGTVMEVAWADAARIPIVIVMEEGNPHWHALFNEVASYIVNDLDEGITLIKALLTPQ